MASEAVPARPRRVLVIGGVAGGASCAARLRRLDESLEIVVFERGPYVSFANCGLPYHVGGVIPDEDSLLVASPELFRRRFAVEVRTEHEVTRIDRERRVITVRDLRSGASTEQPYDALVLAPGAAPIRPPLPGLALPGVFALRSIPDARRIREWIDTHRATHAVVVGGGFIGLELMENFVHRGMAVTVIEKLPQLMPPFDAEMAAVVRRHVESRGVSVVLGDGLASVETERDGLVVVTESGARHVADLVILSIGVKPETELARVGGLTLGARGGIVVDEQMRTSDPAIFAVGDAVELRDVVTGQPAMVPLAGPANRQGRIAADAIAGRASRFRGVQATAVVGVLGLTIASTGASEKGLQRAGIGDFEKIYLHPGHHAGYYPGAKAIHFKLLFSKRDGRVLGAQAVGEEGVDKRIDVVAMAIQLGATVHDLAEAELCYAPQYGAAKDPVNLAGMIAANALNGDMPLADWEKLGETNALVVDVREPDEHATDGIPGALCAPLSSLRERTDKLPRDRELWLHCGVGQRAYYATRLLRQRGFDAKNLSGGFATWQARRDAGLTPSR